MSNTSPLSHLLGQHLINSPIPLRVRHLSAPTGYYFLKDIVRGLNQIKGMDMDTITRILADTKLTAQAVTQLENLNLIGCPKELTSSTDMVIITKEIRDNLSTIATT